MAQPTSPPLIIPLGHYIGAYHAEPGGPLQYHTVRIGRQPIRLQNDMELTLWGIAHGGETGALPWTRQDVLELAEQAEIPDAEDLLDELIDEDIIVEVSPGTDEAIDFAEAHRVMPLLFGQGPGSADPSLHRIGYGTQTAVEVNNFGFELWRLCRLTDDLWSFCDLYGEALRRSAGLSEAETTPELLLTRALTEIQTLVGRHAAYVDASPALWN